MSEILEAIATRSSIRAYTEEPLTKEEIEKLVTAALQAPTAANKQEFHVTVVNKDNPILQEMDADLKASRGQTGSPVKFYYGAPIVMFISADRDFFWSPLDCGIVVENIHLAAHGMGLGSLIIGCVKDTLMGEKKSYYSEKLDFPENYDYQIAIAIGHSATTKAQHTYDKDKQVSYI